MTVAIALIVIVFVGFSRFESTQARLPDEPSTVTSLAQPAGPVIQRINQYDWNKDGCDDLIARNALGYLFLFRGICQNLVATQFQDPVQMINQQYTSNALLLPGDLNQDTCPDLLARIPSNGGAFANSFYVRFGDCGTGFTNDFTYTGDFGAYDWFAAPGTWSGGSCPQIIARTSTTHDLHLFQADCTEPSVPFTNLGTMTTGFEGFDWLMAPARWDSDSDGGYYCGDIITRLMSNASLQFYDGDCDKGFSGSGSTQVGTSWGIFDWLLSGGNWSGDTIGNCPDVLARRSDDGTLRLYAVACGGGFSGAANLNIGGSVDWRQFNYILGNAGPVVSTAIPTVTLGPTASATPTPTPTATTTATASPTATPTPTPTATATASPTASPAQTNLQGDVNCDHLFNFEDLMLLLLFAGSLTQATNCLTGNGNTDCLNDVDAGDLLPLVYYIAGLVYPLPGGCVPIGAALP